MDNTAVLEVCNLTVSYDGLPVLKDIDLVLRQNATHAIVGESGAGKTTLGLSLLGLTEGKTRGRILFEGRDILAAGEEELCRVRGNTISMVFQNTADCLHPLYSVLDQIIETILLHQHVSPGEAREKAGQILAEVGLNSRHAKSFPHQLSGGETQRALIAMAIVNNPAVLVLDEPTASLDPVTKQDIITLLRTVTASRAAVVITHDLAVAAALAATVSVLYGGRVLESGPAADVLKHPRHPYTRGLVRSFPDMTTVKDLQGIPGKLEHGVAGCSFHPRCTQRIPQCLDTVPRLQAVADRTLACHRGGIVPVLEVGGLTKSWHGCKAVDHVSLTLYEGETLAVVGESGSGKTTLAKSIMGLVEADSGHIRLEGQSVDVHTAEFYQKVQLIFQNPKDAISHRMNVLQAVKEPLDINRLGDEAEKLARVKQLLQEVELPAGDNFLKKYPHQLSGGEAQRVVIARALALRPKILIADEPTSALDASVQAKIVKLFLTLQEKMGLALLFITHDIALARKISDRLAVMQQGRIVEAGPTCRITAAPEHPYTRELIAAAGRLM